MKKSTIPEIVFGEIEPQLCSENLNNGVSPL